MQTFLPYPNFKKTVKCLDYRRLGKQRCEARDIYRINIYLKHNKDLFDSVKQREHLIKRYKNHPAVKMWSGYENCLAQYFNICVKEWIKRGYNNTMELIEVPEEFKKPHWLGNRKFHATHKSNLLRKNFEFYSRYGWKEPDNLDYVWP